jgi:hypothetical protein
MHFVRVNARNLFMLAFGEIFINQDDQRLYRHLETEENVPATTRTCQYSTDLDSFWIGRQTFQKHQDIKKVMIIKKTYCKS